MRTGDWLLGVAVLFGVAGCGYPEFGFDGSDPDPGGPDTALLDDTPDPLEETGPFDADVPLDTSDAAPVQDADAEAPIDAGDTRPDATADTKPIVDAPVDTRTDTIVDVAPETPPPLGFCKTSTAPFCADFDETSSLPAGFDRVDTQPGGTLTLDSLSSSAPRSLRASIDTRNERCLAFLQVVRNAPSAGALTRVDAKIRLDGASVTRYVTLLKIQHGGDGRGVSLDVDANGLRLAANGSSFTVQRISGSVPVGRWFHVRLEGRLRVSGGSGAVYIDGATTPTAQISNASTASADVASREINVGLFSDPSSALTARYDDVEVRFAN